MPKRIEEDHKLFRDVYAGRILKNQKKFINNGRIFGMRGKKGKQNKIDMIVRKIDIPHIVYGDNGTGVGRGQGKPGDTVGKNPGVNPGQGQPGQGPGGEGGLEPGEGQLVSVDLDNILDQLQKELELPDLKHKPNPTFEEVQIRYNSISRVGPRSLFHLRRTMLQALKRMCATGEVNDLHRIPGYPNPMRLIRPIPHDDRFRQYKEIKIPASNAVIFFARDGSGSMDDQKCGIVSDMSWWIDAWIRRYYERVERCYVWHDTDAKEVDEHTFYNLRYGGGTVCSSALKHILKQFENRFPIDKWNIYVFYFTDGENGESNKVFTDVLTKEFTPDKVNLFGLTEILSYSEQYSLKGYVDENVKMENLRTTSISGDPNSNSGGGIWGGGWSRSSISDDRKYEEIRKAIVELLGKKTIKS